MNEGVLPWSAQLASKMSDGGNWPGRWHPSQVSMLCGETTDRTVPAKFYKKKEKEIENDISPSFPT